MRVRMPSFVLVLLFCLGTAVPLAAEEPFSSPVAGAPRIVLGYGDSFEQDGARRTHRGADVAAQPGETVRACVSGKVTFSGLVPASGGGRTTAVTVARDDGLKVTCMPLTRASVRSGAQVEAGDGIGTLAQAGDGSSSEAHLHLSVRRGDAYLDPATFLVPTPAPDTSPETPAEPAGRPAVDPPAQPAARPQPSASPAPHTAPAASPAASPAPASAGAPQPVTQPLPHAAGAGGAAAAPHLAPVHSPHPAAPAAPPRAASGAPHAAAVSAAAAPAAAAPVAPLALAAASASSAACRPAAAASSSALAALARAYGGARKVVTALAELLVASALLWPVWRSVSKPLEPSPAVVAVRARE
jgi:hypothetical protein